MKESAFDIFRAGYTPAGVSFRPRGRKKRRNYQKHRHFLYETTNYDYHRHSMGR